MACDAVCELVWSAWTQEQPAAKPIESETYVVMKSFPWEEGAEEGPESCPEQRADDCD